jgi:hypothetical protein
MIPGPETRAVLQKDAMQLAFESHPPPARPFKLSGFGLVHTYRRLVAHPAFLPCESSSVHERLTLSET